MNHRGKFATKNLHSGVFFLQDVLMQPVQNFYDRIQGNAIQA